MRRPPTSSYVEDTCRALKVAVLEYRAMTRSKRAFQGEIALPMASTRQACAGGGPPFHVHDSLPHSPHKRRGTRPDGTPCSNVKDYIIRPPERLIGKKVKQSLLCFFVHFTQHFSTTEKKKATHRHEQLAMAHNCHSSQPHCENDIDDATFYHHIHRFTGRLDKEPHIYLAPTATFSITGKNEHIDRRRVLESF
jgi:hypothetical protein